MLAVHEQSEQAAGRVGNDVTLAPLPSLGGVDPPRAATFRCFHALAINHASRRDEIASHGLANASNKSKIDAPPDPLITPTIEVVLNGGVRRKVLGQCTPLAAGRQDVENCVHHLAEIDFARTANM